jgi:hypothetical protein
MHFTGRALTLPLLLFVLSNPSPRLAPFSVEAPVSGEEFERDNQLQAESDALLPLFDAMPPVPIYLKDEPMLKTGTNTETGAAYTHCYGQEIPTIFVKKIFYQKANRKQLINLLKHEMTHAWLCRQRLMSGHDDNFRRKFKQIGGFGN